MRKAAALAKKSVCITLVAAVALVSGCQSDPIETGSSPEFLEGETWAEQRAIAESMLARYAQDPGYFEDASRSSQSPRPAVTSSSSDPSATTLRMGVDSVVVDPRTTRMKVTFMGARGPATSPCGADYFAEAVESAKAVVVVILEQSNPYSGVCPMVAVGRTATLNLSRPLGDRVILDRPKDPAFRVSTAPVTD